MKTINRIGILTSGGDAPGMNACIRAVVRSATANNISVIGIKRGFSGLLDGDYVELDARSVANTIQRGGTFLETSRCKEMKTKDGIQRAIDAIQNQMYLDALIVVGGDGSFRGAMELSEKTNIQVIGIPGTIDNDVYGTDYSIGFDTALNTALDAIDKIRDTADSLQRPFFIEVMGKYRGFIALDVGIAGGAENVLIPETKTDLNELSTDIQKSLEKGKKSSIIVVAEGDDAGGVFKTAEQVWEKLKLEYRVCVLGHLQRGGSPTARDRILASKLGVAAVDTILQGKTGYMVGEHNNKIVLTPFADTWNKQKSIDLKLLETLKLLST